MTNIPHDEPVFHISVVARMVGLHQQTLRMYERLGLLQPHRTRGNRRLYSPRDVERVEELQRLMNDLGVNLAGAEVIVRLNRQIEQLHSEREALLREVVRLRSLLGDTSEEEDDQL